MQVYFPMTLSCIQISNTVVSYCWRVVKPFIAVLMLYSSGAVVLWGAPYIGWAQTCMGLAMAGACAKHRSCYWSQTDTTKTNPGIVMIESSLLGIGCNPAVCEGIYILHVALFP